METDRPTRDKKTKRDKVTLSFTECTRLSITRAAVRSIFWFGVCAVIWLSLTHSSFPDIGVDSHWEHLIAYSALGFIGAASFGDKRSWFLLGTSLAVLGGSLELAQEFVPGRTPSLVDGVMDLAGIALGMALFTAGKWFQSTVWP